MAWVKLDDAMPHHPKVMAAGPQAFALDVAGICYSNKHSTDGFIPKASLRAVLPALPTPSRYAARLVEAGRWVEVDGGWMIHDVADYQPTAAESKELSKKRALAGRQGGIKSGESRRTKPEAPVKQNASTESNPVPTRPDPIVDKSTTTADFIVFNKTRARTEAQKKSGVWNVSGYAHRMSQDPEFITESKRLFAHKDCSKCGGRGFYDSDYAPGAGVRQIRCEEPV